MRFIFCGSRSCVRVAAMVTIGLLGAGCSNSEVEPLPRDMLAIGTWGGDDAGAIVSEDGVHVHIGCTLGDMPPNVPLDDEGRFAIDGSYVLRAYPVAVGPSLPAQFAGKVKGEILTLAIAVDDTVENKVVALGPVTLRYGQTPEMRQCPICRVPGSVANQADGP